MDNKHFILTEIVYRDPAPLPGHVFWEDFKHHRQSNSARMDNIAVFSIPHPPVPYLENSGNVQHCQLRLPPCACTACRAPRQRGRRAHRDSELVPDPLLGQHEKCRRPRQSQTCSSSHSHKRSRMPDDSPPPRTPGRVPPVNKYSLRHIVVVNSIHRHYILCGDDGYSSRSSSSNSCCILSTLRHCSAHTSTNRYTSTYTQH